MPLPLSRKHSLGPCIAPLRGVHGDPMRLKMDVLKTVFYLGTKPLDGQFRALGTAFWLGFEEDGKPNIYLVTAKHVAECYGDDPIYLRLNTRDGVGKDFYLDPLQPSAKHFKWYFHPDPSVDLAVLFFQMRLDDTGIDWLAINSLEVVNRTTAKEASPVGCGDLCYAVGLFSLAPGTKQNFPVIHTGNIARMASRDELIPQQQNGGEIVDQEGYLVQLSNLGGLSGAPVFVRSGFCIRLENGEYGMVTRESVDLLGVWSGSWEGPSAGSPHMRVPVGMGIVVPSERLLELLTSEPVRANRREWWSQITASKADVPSPAA